MLVSSSSTSFYAPKFNFCEELTAITEETKKSNFTINFSSLTGTYTEPLTSFEDYANIIISDDDSEIKKIPSNEDACIFLGDFPNDSTFNIDINTPEDEILIDIYKDVEILEKKPSNVKEIKCKTEAKQEETKPVARKLPDLAMSVEINQ